MPKPIIIQIFWRQARNYTRDKVIGLNEGLTVFIRPIRAHLSNTFGSHKHKVYMGLLSSSKFQLTAVARKTNFTKLNKKLKLQQKLMKLFFLFAPPPQTNSPANTKK